MKNKLSLTEKIIVLSLICVVLGVFLPGFIMYLNDTFWEKDIVNKLDPSIKAKYIKNRDFNLALEHRKRILFTSLADTNENLSTKQIDEIYKSSIILDKLKMGPSIQIAPYYPKSRLLILWPFAYFGLSCLAFLIKLNSKFRISIRDFFRYTFLLIIFTRWPTWLRNTDIGNINRVIYSANNFDVSKLGFFMQEIQSLISILLVAYIFCKWLGHSQNLNLAYSKNKNFSQSYFLKLSRNLRFIYQQWQISSILLASSFGFYTFHFWLMIHDNHDYRYMPHAIILHLFWGLTWCIITIPLYLTKEYYTSLKEMYLMNQFSNQNMELSPNENIKNLIISGDPISTQNQTVTTIISGVAFLFPLIKAFI
ncbi:hypothetical protein [Mucilaginibacter aquaedulcis]|uniref:hypothetical protein n=1 Tax=Mucilaginibacter aquaedulcis TaxID=1187081 RepID=UPI0025B5ACDE|nr:hypothetical protein [Mucilaginibacter aquaedulcis]MDN3549328.1 hypothetical protein [Mucilaginibacter aquaedulcis]